MKQVIYEYRAVNDFRQFLKTDAALSDARHDMVSALIQIYAPPNTPELSDITTILLSDIPDAVIVGASSVGEIANHTIHPDVTVLIFSFFNDTHLVPFSMTCQEEKEHALGESLGRVIATVSDITAIFLLTTAHSLNTSTLLQGLNERLKEHLIFGGCASEYAHGEQNWVLHQHRIIQRGVVAVVFSSKTLQISTGLSCGWRPFGNKKTITDTDGLKVVSIDHKPAEDVLQQYVETVNTDLFSKHASVFALMVERNHHLICRVPMLKDKYGAILFAADIYPNEIFQIGIGDPELMLPNSQQLAKTQQEFQPEGIFVFACGIRLMLLQEDAVLETQSFSNIAPSGGFYTSGEILKPPEENIATSLYNTCLLAVGLREQAISETAPALAIGDELETSLESKNQYEQRHAKVIANLLKFVQAVTNELEETNQALLNQSITDKLTGLFNRVELDRVLTKEIARTKRYGIPMSVVILDVDNFKRVNDQFGHIVGDSVLVEMSGILRANVRASDTVGRWGGEEFLIILPHTSAAAAFDVAEKIRKVLGDTPFDVAGKQTASFGVASCQPNDEIKTLLAKADIALYQAKHQGKNQVVISSADESV